MGPRDVRSSVLSPEEAMCVAFRRHTLLPLDDCLYALQASLPHLSRSALHLFVAIDRTSKFAFSKMVEGKAGKMVAAQFLRELVEAVPYTIHTVLTDNGIQFACAALRFTNRPTATPWPTSSAGPATRTASSVARPR